MSATCVDSHHISEIQRRYYQNSMLSAPRQEKKIVARSNLTGSQRRRLKRKKREEEELKESNKDMESREAEGDKREGEDLNKSKLMDVRGKEKKVSKRSVHWNALSEGTQTTEGNGIIETEDPNADQELQDNEGPSTFFGWLSSYFRSR